MAGADRRSAVARWGQVARELRHQIEQQELQPGAQLPSENELAEIYGVSRITVRQALSVLAEEGLVERRHGTGTFVSATLRIYQHDLAIAQPWRERITRDSSAVARSMQLDSMTREPPPAALLADLGGRGVSIGDRHFRRLQLVDSEPIGLSDSWLAPGLAPGIEDEPLIDGSLSVTLERRFGLRVGEVQSFIHAESAPRRVAELLSCPTEAPLIVVNSVSTSSEGLVIEASRTYWIGRQVRFHHEQVFDRRGVEGSSS